MRGGGIPNLFFLKMHGNVDFAVQESKILKKNFKREKTYYGVNKVAEKERKD